MSTVRVKRPRGLDIIDLDMEPPASKRTTIGNDDVNDRNAAATEPTVIPSSMLTPLPAIPSNNAIITPTLNQTSTTEQKKTFIVDSFAALPDEFKKSVLKAGITAAEADKHLEIILNILHFKTKYDFFTTEQITNKNKLRPRRYNCGQSLVSPDIVSTASLDVEANTLLDATHRRKDYKTMYQAGKGGFGRVFLAKSFKDKGQKVAVKRIPHVTTKQKRKNFQEIRFLKFCESHQNIIRYHRAFVVKEELWLVTEFVQGGTLTEAVNTHKFTEPEIAYVAKQVLHALDYLHDHQLAHRDLKSANIMLDITGSVKIIDFGLCSDISQGPVVHMVGSPFWMPPEMIRREPHGLSVDVWSFAICIMEIANGHPPNRKSSIKAMFQAGTIGYPSPFENPKAWSPEFHDFLKSCLHIEPEKRSTVKQLLAHEFLNKAASREHMRNLFRQLFSKSVNI